MHRKIQELMAAHPEGITRSLGWHPVFLPSKLPVPARSTYNRYCSRVLYSTINRIFVAERDRRITELMASYPEGITCSGDGQYDSMGKSAFYCTYSFMDNKGHILD